MHDLRGPRVGAEHDNGACPAFISSGHAHDEIRP
jgi:hypothetical protein